MSDAIKQETIVDVDSLEATQNLAIRLAGQLEGLNASLKNAPLFLLVIVEYQQSFY